MSDQWRNLNDVLREDTEQEADWAAKHAPNTSKPRRQWRAPSSPVPPEEASFKKGESLKDRVNRLVDAGYSRLSVATAVGLSLSRVAQIHSERERLGILESQTG